MKRTVSVLLALSIVAGVGQTTAWAETPHKQAQQEKEVNDAALLEMEDVEYFLQKAEEFSMNDPSATLEQINDYLKKEMKIYYSEKLESNTIDYPIPTQAGELNPQEQALWVAIALLRTNGVVRIKSSLHERISSWRKW